MKWSVAFKALLPVLVITFSAVLSLGSTQIDDASSVVWCEQSEHPIYNLNDGVHCEKPAELIVFPISYTEFETSICRVMSKHSQLVRFQHFNRFSYSKRQAANNAYALWKWAIINLHPDPESLWLEFGVAGGFSVNVTSILKSRVSSKPVYGFDWFQGLPDTWSDLDFNSVGLFSQHSEIPRTRPGVKLVVGLFNQTLVKFLSSHRDEAISIVNFDADIYSATAYVLEKLLPHLRRGSILHFHEMIRYESQAQPCRGSDEMRALYDVMKSLHLGPRFSQYLDRGGLKLKLLPYKSHFFHPLVFVVV